MNILKLTAAEFKKIFKRPSVFVMAILLVVSILVSIALFNPAAIIDPTIKYANASTAKDYYDNFYDDSIFNSKRHFDQTFVAADTYINYYIQLEQHNRLLTTYYNDIIDTVNLMKLESSPDAKQVIRSTQLLPKLNTFANKYKQFDDLSEFNDITTYSTTQYNYKSLAPRNYYALDACSALNSFISSVQADKNEISVYELINEYETNDYESKLYEVLNNGINFVPTTITGLAFDFNTLFSSYKTEITAGRGRMTHINIIRKDLSLVTNTLLNYLDTLTKSNYPIITINKMSYLELDSILKDSINLLNISDQVSSTDYNSHVRIKDSLDRLLISKHINDLTKVSYSSNSFNLKQVHMPSSITKELTQIKQKTDENKAGIINNIVNLIADESITNISREITNYSLLAYSYNSLISDKINTEIISNYDISVYSEFYGSVYENYNAYETNERIALNQYYLDNNKYSNSYINNFAFNQNSGVETNAYDFMYFALELCTIIIIVFAMMLVCNLITGETESGTIKLLLVRPYKRSKILTAKLLATIFFVITFMLFSTIISMVGGLCLFGEPAASTVLAVANATTAFEANPFALMILNIIFLSIDVLFFVFLALMISILFKNYAASITAAIVLLIANYALNIITGGAFWYTLLPGMNLHLFKYFGNAFVPLASGTPGLAGILQTLLLTTIESSMNLWFSILLTSIYSLVFLTISYSVFQRRDF